MKSIRSLRRNIGNKTHPMIVETLLAARRQKAWHPVAHKIAGPTRNHASVNLSYLERNTKEGDTVIVIGKVLGTGNITKKIRLCAISFSSSALNKLRNVKADTNNILDEIKKNPKAEGIKVFS